MRGWGVTATIADRDALGLLGLAEGTWLNGKYLTPSEIATCTRCGLQRRIQPGRKRSDLCIDCSSVERAARKQAAEAPAGRPWTDDKGITTWAVPMSAEDMAWCEKNAAEWKQRRPVIYYGSQAAQVAA